MVLHITTVKEDGEGISNLYIILSLQTSIKVAGNPSNTKCLILLAVQSFIAKPELIVSTTLLVYQTLISILLQNLEFYLSTKMVYNGHGPFSLDAEESSFQLCERVCTMSRTSSL